MRNMLTELVELHRLCVDMDLGPGMATRFLVVTCSFVRVSCTQACIMRIDPSPFVRLHSLAKLGFGGRGGN
jgi:hypothetical protein